MSEIIMAPPYEHSASAADDDYIDMEIISSHSSTFLFHFMKPIEFEFQMSTPSSSTLETDHNTCTTSSSPADELFYKGNLLPLHLPLRLQMFEKLLHHHNSTKDVVDDFQFYTTTPIMMATTTTPTATSTPYHSCNISPIDSRKVSRELNLEEYMWEYPTDDQVSGYIDGGGDCNNNNSNTGPKRSWAKKFNRIKQYGIIGSKLKASRAYLKALLSKSGCSHGSSSSTPTVVNGQKKTSEDCSSRVLDRRSFSMATSKRNSTTKLPASSPSSSSSSTKGYHNHGFPFLKRSSSSVSSEIENPIQGAIAHCKQSQQKFHQVKTAASEVGFFSRSQIGFCQQPPVRVHLGRG